jgi:hypothetical protein
MGVTANNILYYFKGGGGWVNDSATLTNTMTVLRSVHPILEVGGWVVEVLNTALAPTGP